MTTEKDRLLENVFESVRAYCANAHNYSFDTTNPIVRLHEPTFSAEEINSALECLLSTQVTMGKKVKTFERSFADLHEFKHGVMVNSGSSANLLAVTALTNKETPDHLVPGDEVIVPALCWSTTVWPLVQNGLIPIIVDIDPLTLNIDPNEVERAIGPKTRGVMAVPVYGNPCDMDALVTICAQNQLTLIEDCCEALGARYGSKPVGKFGRVGTFSFYYSHHMTTLEGGMCVSDDTTLAENMRIIRAHGWIREVEDPQAWTTQYPDIDPKFLFVNTGYNLRPTELQGAIGNVQLTKLDNFVQTRRKNAAYFRRELDAYADTLVFQEETPKSQHSWFGFPLCVRQHAPFKVADIRMFLKKQAIETRPIICGNIARQPGMKLYEHRIVGNLHCADYVMERGFSFGNHQAIDDCAREYVVGAIKNFFDSGMGA